MVSTGPFQRGLFYNPMTRRVVKHQDRAERGCEISILGDVQNLNSAMSNVTDLCCQSKKAGPGDLRGPF